MAWYRCLWMHESKLIWVVHCSFCCLFCLHHARSSSYSSYLCFIDWTNIQLYFIFLIFVPSLIIFSSSHHLLIKGTRISITHQNHHIPPLNITQRRHQQQFWSPSPHMVSSFFFSSPKPHLTFIITITTQGHSTISASTIYPISIFLFLHNQRPTLSSLTNIH